MKRNKKRNRLMLLLILLLAVSIGYALLSTTLKINGSTTITKNNWSVYWDNVQVESESVDATTNIPVIGQDTNDPVNTKVTWSTTLSLPGDYYEFTVDAVNAGSVDAMITSIDNTVTPSLPEYIKYSVTYADGGPVSENDSLPKKVGSTNTTQKYKVRVEFLDTITPAEMDAIPSQGLTYTFTYEVTYGQGDSNAKEVVPYVATCQGCVYSKNTTTKTLGDSLGNEGTDYFKNYNDLSSAYFLGYKLNSNDEITEIYGCVIENSKTYCYKGGVNEASLTDKPVYEANVAIQAKAYPSCNATPASGGSICSGTSTQTNLQTNGMVTVGPTAGSPCMVNSNSEGICY